jgi:hypothetical protein
VTAQALQAPMVMTPFGGAVPTGVLTTSLGSDQTFTFNGAGDKVAFVFQSPGTTVPDIVAFVVATVSVAGTTGTIDCTLETLASDGTPSGTAVTNSATASATASTTGVKTASGMAGTATVTEGQEYAVVLTAGSGWDRTLTIKLSTGSAQGNIGFPYTLTKDSAGAWAKSTGTNCGWCLGLAASGGTYLQIPGLLSAYSLASYATFSDATNPDERGNRFSLAVPATCIGALVIYNGGTTPGANDDYSVSLYSSHTGTPSQLATKAMDGDAQGAGAPHIVRFTSAVDLTANTTYALALKANGSDNASLLRWDYSANADLAGVLGTSFYSTTRDGGTGAPTTGGNSFTDDNAKVYAVFPLFSKFDDGAGGGGGASGGFVIGG